MIDTAHFGSDLSKFDIFENWVVFLESLVYFLWR